jgi:hypothetical protein
VLQLSFIAARVAVIIIMPQFFHQERDGQIAILNLLQDNKLPLPVILKQVQDDEGVSPEMPRRFKLPHVAVGKL